MSSVSPFQAMMAKRAKLWKKASTATPRKRTNLGVPDVRDGQYVAVISAAYGVAAKTSTPWARLTGTIAGGSYEGLQPGKFYYLEGKEPVDESSDERRTSEQELAGDLKTLLPDVEVEDEIAAGNVAGLLDEVNKLKPRCRIGVRNWTSEKGKNAGKPQQDVYFNDLVSAGESNGEVQAEETVEEAVEESEGDEGTEEGEAEYAPAKGDSVNFQPKGARSAGVFEVVMVSQPKQTVKVKDAKGKTYSDVAWSDIEPVE